MKKHIPKDMTGVLQNSGANQFEIRATKQWMERNQFDNVVTQIGKAITPTLLAEYSKTARMPLKWAVGVFIFQMRENGVILYRNGQPLI